MEATVSSHQSRPQLCGTKRNFPNIGGKTTSFLQCYRPRYATNYTSLKRSSSEFSRRHFVLSNRSYRSKETENVSFFFEDQQRAYTMSVKAASAEYVNQEVLVPNVGDEVTNDKSSVEALQSRPKPFVNRFLNFVHIGSLLNGVLLSHFSRVRYAEDELGDFAPELKLSLFQLGIRPQIGASIVMQANMPKEIADYLNKMGARIPNIKPEKATVEYLTKIQASTRFWGGLLLTILATTSSILDHYLRSINEGFSIGFTSILIIVGSIIELRRSYQAYNVMPSLSNALRRYGV